MSTKKSAQNICFSPIFPNPKQCCLTKTVSNRVWKDDYIFSTIPIARSLVEIWKFSHAHDRLKIMNWYYVKSGWKTTEGRKIRATCGRVFGFTLCVAYVDAPRHGKPKSINWWSLSKFPIEGWSRKLRRRITFRFKK